MQQLRATAAEWQRGEGEHETGISKRAPLEPDGSAQTTEGVASTALADGVERPRQVSAGAADAPLRVRECSRGKLAVE